MGADIALYCFSDFAIVSQEHTDDDDGMMGSISTGDLHAF